MSMTFCGQNDCRFCIEGQCVANVRKLVPWNDVSIQTCLECKAYENKYSQNKNAEDKEGQP